MKWSKVESNDASGVQTPEDCCKSMLARCESYYTSKSSKTFHLCLKYVSCHCGPANNNQNKVFCFDSKVSGSKIQLQILVKHDWNKQRPINCNQTLRNSPPCSCVHISQSRRTRMLIFHFRNIQVYTRLSAWPMSIRFTLLTTRIPHSYTYAVVLYFEFPVGMNDMSHFLT